MMPSPREPEILPPTHQEMLPRTKRGRVLFADENLNLLSHLLDDWFRVPGTSIRFGLDGIVGMIPGVGDIIAGFASCIIVVAGWFRGVPYITLLRMVVNLGLEVLIGAVPFIGNFFDIAWKANRRNYALLTRHLHEPRRHTWRDWIFLSFILLALAAVFFAPIVVIAWLLAQLRQPR